MNQPWKLLLAITSLSSLSLFADSHDQTSNAMYEPEGVTTNPKELITPPVAPRVTHGADVFLTADFIWWKSQISGLEYATIGSKSKELPFQFEPGFKVGLGVDMAHDGWDLYAQYTWLNTPKHSNHLSVPGHLGFSTLVSAFSTPTIGALSVIPTSSASASRKASFNVLDVELGRNFFISKRLTLRPNFGLKFAWLDEHIHFHYNGNTTYTTIATADSHFKQYLFGVGGRAGLNTVWHFSPCWGLYGDVALTALWGKFNDKVRIKLLTSGQTESVETSNVHEKSQYVIPVIEYGIGLTYMTWFYDESYMFSLKAGWEEQIWVHYNQLLNVPSKYNGDLSMQGLTIQAGFAF